MVMWYFTEWTHRLGALLARSVASDTATRHIVPILGSLGVIGLAGSWAANLTGLRAQQPGLTKSIDVVVFVLITAATIGVCISRVHIVRHSIIDGRFVMRDRVIPGIDEAALRDQAQAYYEKMRMGYWERSDGSLSPAELFPGSFPEAGRDL